MFIVKYTARLITALLLLFCIVFGFVISQLGKNDSSGFASIDRWSVLPVPRPDSSAPLPLPTGREQGWLPADLEHPLGISSPDSPSPEGAWIRLDLPQLKDGRSALFIENIYARSIDMFLEGEPVFHHIRDYNIDANKLLIPLDRSDSGKSLLVYIHSASKRLGIQGEVKVGEYSAMQRTYITIDMLDFIIGCALVLVALIMLVCTFFTRGPHLKSWLSLCIIILTLGLLLITYTTAVYSLFDHYGKFFAGLLDRSLFIFLPTMAYFFLSVIGEGKFGIVRKWFYVQSGYSTFCLLFSVVNELTNERYDAVYYLFSVKILGGFILLESLLLITAAAIDMFRGNRNAFLLFIGFGLLAAAVISDLILFYTSNFTHRFVLWRWGIVAFVVSLVTILGKQIAEHHEQVVKYSKELEQFNKELQRSDKMEIVSGLAASVAHEVRNPLQVTRGFLQLLGKKAPANELAYMKLAIEELDRAANIISDFLTFAKPELESVKRLHISDELSRIQGILNPLANMNGGRIILYIQNDLFIRGDSSKFRQAIVNIVKNSIEALQEQGLVHILAYWENKEVVIRITDNGEGMEPEALAKLGEPYYSNKTRGTGLGLMVTFRIIEAMSGKLTYSSRRGIGTEAVIRFPADAECEQVQKERQSV